MGIGMGWGGFAVKGTMQINMKITHSQDKIFPLVAENKFSPFSFFFVESPVRPNIAFACLSYRSWLHGTY